jgi:DNA-binding transcriptional MerR regulator
LEEVEMIHARIRFTLAVGIAFTNVVIAIAQESAPTSASQQSTPDTSQVLDQLIEHNQQLEKQNQQMEEQNQQLQKQNQDLMEEIKALRGAAVPNANGKQQAAQATASQSSSGKTQPQTGQSSAQSQGANDDKTRYPQAAEGNNAIFGEFNPGRGFTVGRSEYGELNLSGYMVARFLDQMPANQTAIDHLGRPIQISPRKDFQFHRVMLFSQGWLFSPKFQYSTFLWTVQDTNQVAVGGALYYTFGNYMSLGAGWNAYPGTQSLQGSHPYWESYDRVMADEFFRPYFSQGVFAKGNLLPKLEYRWMVGNNNSNLDVPAVKLDRDLSAGGALTWYPTTGEFGPRGAFGDYENHQNLATRFNLAYTYSPEERQATVGTSSGINTTLRLSDSLNLFDTGALAPGVTIERAHYQMVSAAAGMKYHGLWIQGEGYGRLLDHFIANGKLPTTEVRDSGFYVQVAGMIVPKRFELYGGTSYIFGQFGDPKEFIVGTNYYPWDTRNLRLNTQLIEVDHSPVNSTFGFYLGRLTGPIFSIGMTALY